MRKMHAETGCVNACLDLDFTIGMSYIQLVYNQQTKDKFNIFNIELNLRYLTMKCQTMFS